MTQIYLDIAVSAPLRRSFDYLPPRNISVEKIQQLQPGMRILVPFGHRTTTGILLQIKTESSFDNDKLKHAISILDNSPIFPPHLFEIALWAARYYQHPIGDAIIGLLPKLLRSGNPAKFDLEIYWQLTEAGKCIDPETLRRSKKQMEVISLLNTLGQLSQVELTEYNLSAAVLKTLEEKSLIMRRPQEILPLARPVTTPLLAQEHLLLNAEQQAACSAVLANLDKFGCYLLQGVTGSGKTEVYLQLIDKVLQQGKQILVLVPEIGLTPQTTSRFRKRFNCHIVSMHSGHTDRERLKSWMAASHGYAEIVIGTRSALFTPLLKPGLIVVDEEHDGSFKQQEGFRYSARDLAILRAKAENIPIVLGTATPSLESLNNVEQGRSQLLRLNLRAGNAKPPEFKLLDIKGLILREGMAEELIAAIATELDQGNQVILFLNRRGFAPALMCHHCGWLAECMNCDTRLTVHHKANHLRCHHCDCQQPIPTFCPECKSYDLHRLGIGTERSEAALKTIFPGRSIFRIDRDTTSRKNSLESMLEKIHQGEPAVLVGTQMLAKGHHFSDVTLVAILDADFGLFSSDFRGPEKMGQLLTQVAGRAGRAEKPGRVLIQTHNSDHPLLTTLVNKGYEEFAKELLIERSKAGLPPFSFFSMIRADANSGEKAQRFLAAVRQLAQQLASTNCNFVGPLPAIIEKRSNRFHHQLLIQCTSRTELQKVLSQLCLFLENHPLAKSIHWSIDVDPVDVF